MNDAARLHMNVFSNTAAQVKNGDPGANLTMQSGSSDSKGADYNTPSSHDLGADNTLSQPLCLFD